MYNVLCNITVSFLSWPCNRWRLHMLLIWISLLSLALIRLTYFLLIWNWYTNYERVLYYYKQVMHIIFKGSGGKSSSTLQKEVSKITPPSSLSHTSAVEWRRFFSFDRQDDRVRCGLIWLLLCMPVGRSFYPFSAAPFISSSWTKTFHVSFVSPGTTHIVSLIFLFDSAFTLMLQ